MAIPGQTGRWPEHYENPTVGVRGKRFFIFRAWALHHQITWRCGRSSDSTDWWLQSQDCSCGAVSASYLQRKTCAHGKTHHSGRPTTFGFLLIMVFTSWGTIAMINYTGLIVHHLF